MNNTVKKMKNFQLRKRVFLNRFTHRYPLVHQYDQIDCGPAALLSVLKFYGGDSSLVYIRELCQTNVQGTTMSDMVKTARHLGFEAYGARGEYEDLLKEQMPCIAHVALDSGNEHFMVIYEMNSQGVLVADPAKGIYQLQKNKFTQIWKEKAVILLRPKLTLFQHSSPGWLEWIWGYIKEQESWISQTIFLGLVYTLLGLLTAIFVQWIIDRFIPRGEYDKIIFTGLCLFFVLTVKNFAGFFRQKFLVILNKRISIKINTQFLDHLFRIPKKFFDTRKTGDLTARINDSVKIQQAILFITNTTIIDGMMLLGSFALLFYFAPLIARMTLPIIPLYGMLLYSKSRSIKNKQNEVLKAHSEVESSYIDSLGGMDDILGFNLSYPFIKVNKNLFERFQTKIENLRLTQAKLGLFNGLMGTLFTILLLCVGALNVIKGKLLLGQMMAAYSLFSHILPSIGNLVQADITLQGANIAAQRVRDILLVEQESKGGKLPFILKKLFCLNGASFSWPKSQPLFENISVVLEKGKFVSLWGPNGSGKSTLVHILQRKYDLPKGQILVDNVPAEQIDLLDFRKNVAVVPQTIKLFNGTLIENIILGREFTSFDEILQRIDEIGLTPFIKKFEQGLFTLLGEDGRKLSGGEKQILAIIRAIYEYPKVLILDEGFNAIDLHLEELIFTTLKKYAQKNAVFMVTHNLKTIYKTDYAYILKDKRIIESGPPGELLSRENLFRSFLPPFSWSKNTPKIIK